MKNKLKVIKIGGKLIDDEARLEKFLAVFARLKGNKILIHGGGSMANRLSLKLGINPRMVDGRRITTSADIEIVTMVYAGWINKRIIARLQQHGCNAIGLSGADANTIVARKRPVKEIDYGFVGDIEKVNTSLIQTLLSSGLTPVFSAITHDGNGRLLNTNSDTVAAEIAIAMSELYETKLLYCFEKKGVLENSDDILSVIPLLDFATYRHAAETGSIHNGMLPKLHTGFTALERKVTEVIIGDDTILDDDTKLFTRLILKNEN